MADETSRLFQLEFRDYFEIIRRRKLTVIGAIVVVFVTGLFLSVREQKIYRASAEVLINSVSSAGADVQPDLDTESRLVQSEAVRARANEEVPGVGSVSVSIIGTKIVRVSAEDAVPSRAVETVNAYVKAYTEYRQEQEVDRLLRAAEETDARIADLDRQVRELSDQLDERLADVQARYAPVFGETAAEAGARQLALARETAAVEAELRPRRDTFQRQQLLLEGNLQELLARSQRAGEGVQVLASPTEPTEPIRPKPVEDGVKAFGMGLVLGLCLAFLFEYFDDSVQSREDLQRAVGHQKAVLGVIPTAQAWKDASRSELVSITDPKSPTAEAYRALRTSVHFAGLEEKLAVLSITSPSPGEGKTTTLANLAVVLAESGRRVVILDCDLRRPRVHTFFGLSNEIGFTSVMIGEAPLSVALQKVPDVSRLYLLASGPIPPNPSELLASSRFADVLRLLKADGTVLLIDTPPLLPVTDAAVIAPHCDRTLLVVAAGKSTKKHVRNAVELLEQVDAPFAGVVLNKADNTKRDGYYRYYYATDDDYLAGDGAGRNGAAPARNSSANGARQPPANGAARRPAKAKAPRRR
ncbi:MAG: polysaccharide biosynthesis tyrosine autokinase [Actinomycetota bacterium]